MSILSLIALPHPLNLLHNPHSEVLGGEDGELAAMAEDGVHEDVGRIAAEGEEGGGGRILALRHVEGLGVEVVDLRRPPFRDVSGFDKSLENTGEKFLLFLLFIISFITSTKLSRAGIQGLSRFATSLSMV